MNYKIEIIQDDYAANPRTEWDNLAKMVCFHRRYKLGDKHYYDAANYDSWDEMRNAIIKEENPSVILPLYLIDHSGISISTKPFGCPWDSGQIGFIYISAETIRKEFNVKRVTQRLRNKLHDHVNAEVEVYDAYLRGDTWGYRIVKEDEVIEQVFGYYGRKHAEEEAESSLMYYNKVKEVAL